MYPIGGIIWQFLVVNQKSEKDHKMKSIEPLAAIILSILIVIGCREGERITAVEDVHLVPMTEEKILENQTVLV